jgi:hypothetical protein
VDLPLEDALYLLLRLKCIKKMAHVAGDPESVTFFESSCHAGTPERGLVSPNEGLLLLCIYATSRIVFYYISGIQ